MESLPFIRHWNPCLSCSNSLRSSSIEVLGQRVLGWTSLMVFARGFTLSPCENLDNSVRKTGDVIPRTGPHSRHILLPCKASCHLQPFRARSKLPGKPFVRQTPGWLTGKRYSPGSGHQNKSFNSLLALSRIAFLPAKHNSVVPESLQEKQVACPQLRLLQHSRSTPKALPDP